MKTIVAVCVSLLFSGMATAASVEDDVRQYSQLFGVEHPLDVEAIDAFEWKGISDPRLFDTIERTILAEAPNNNSDKNAVNAINYYIEALGYSGQAKYAPTLQKVVLDPRYKRHATVALENLTLYAKWNPIISNRASFDPKQSDDVNRVLNMIHSDDFQLKKIGAKRVYFSTKDAVLLEALSTEIRASYMSIDPAQTDPIAWMLKGLGSAKDAKYRPLLEEVRANAKTYKISDYAKRALDLR